MDKDWIQLDPAELADRVKVELNGATVELEPSIFDRPEAIRGAIQYDRRAYMVELRYRGDEERESEVKSERLANDHVRVWIGCNSGRIMRILFDLEKLDANNEAKVDVDEIKRLAERLLGTGNGNGITRRIGNVSAARQALEKIDTVLAAG